MTTGIICIDCFSFAQESAIRTFSDNSQYALPLSIKVYFLANYFGGKSGFGGNATVGRNVLNPNDRFVPLAVIRLMCHLTNKIKTRTVTSTHFWT